MDIMIKAQITLTQDDIRQALTNFITENGFDMQGKEAEFSDLPDCITVDVASDELPQEAPKAKRASRKTAEPAKPSVTAEAKQAASEEAKAVLAQGKELLDEAKVEEEKPAAVRPNPFASAPKAPADTDEIEEPEDQPLGQDILDAEPVVEEQPKPVTPVRPNPFADPAPVAAGPTAAATPVKRDPAKSIFA